MKNITRPPARRSRREFVKLGALLGGSALVGEQLSRATPSWLGSLGRAEASYSPYPLMKPENIVYSVCLQCNTGCGIKVKLLEGVAVKIDGNPLSPWNLTPHLPYNTPIGQVAAVDGLLCPKGQAGIQSAYDPYRLVKVLKRAGRRGENKWKTIPFEQALDEIVNGGLLFKDVPEEETRMVQGLKDIYALRDSKLAKEIGADAAKIPKKEMTLEQFKAKYKDHLDKLIDPDHPDLGPRNNQLVFFWGRLKGGRSELIKRFTSESFGSANAHGHTTVCQGSLYFTCKAMSEQYVDGKWTGGKKFYWQADTGNSEFIIFVGASPFEGNYGPPLRSVKVTEGIFDGGMRIVVIDPRFSKTAAKAWKWLPIKPGTEAALALAITKWIIENKKYDAKYLANCNKAAAKADAEPTWTNAAWLVRIDSEGKPEAFLRAKDIGISDKDLFVASKGGQAIALDPSDETNAVEGDLFVDTTIGGIRVKSGLQILRESASARTMEEAARICGLESEDIVQVAAEFTSHGKKAAADVHRGVSQHTNGFYNVFAWMTLNLLIGNFDWKGGMVQLSTYDITGGKTGQPFNFGKMHPDKANPFGVSLIRHETKYEETTLFTGYPAKRHWYPLSSDIYQEIVPSAGDSYPYPIKALILYMGSPVYALPAGHTNIEILADPKKIPLFIVSDIVVGETSMYADYIFPDTSFLERWEFQGSHPSVTQKVQPVRQPSIAPLTDRAKVYGQEIPLSLEALLLGLAEKLALPGFGKDGFSAGVDFTHPDQFYLRMAANITAGDKPGDEVPDADDEEMRTFLQARRHLPKYVFDADRWRGIVGEKWWKKVVYVLNRGGRFQSYESSYVGEQVANKYGTLINMYQEKTVKTKHSMTGKYLYGYPAYLPSPTDILGRELKDKGYDLNLITFREISHTKSRTISNYWLLALLPENKVLINKIDAQTLGLRDGQKVKIASASNPEGVWDLKNGHVVPMKGKIRVVEGLRPGVVAFSLGHGHFAYGAVDIFIDGLKVPADPRRHAGVHLNAAMRVDPVLKNTCLVDPVGGSAVFYDTHVKLIPE